MGTDAEVKQGDEDWRKHPRYLADAGGLFGAPPGLVCVCCDKKDWELFYGHCRQCADTKSIPQKMPHPQKFHDTLSAGTSIVVEGLPKKSYAWWHWRHWFRVR